MSTVPLSTLQTESARTNEALGVIAFLVGVVIEIEKTRTVEEARTLAEMARQTLDEWHAGMWTPGPGDDPADWRKR